ncbi:cation diffusion facilitator family transporter [Candidatus Omnitrophota bacterium]
MKQRVFKENQEKLRYGYKAVWISILGNMVLFVIKIACGTFINSISLIADSIHSLSDSITSVIVLISFKASEKPPDEEHPFGHGRAENVAALIIAFMLLLVGAGIIRNAVRRFFDPPAVNGNLLIAGIIVVTIVVKEWMARFSFRVARKIESQALNADAWHHRCDAVSSALVIAAIIASYYGYFKVDALLGGLVAVIIIIIAGILTKQAASHLLGQAPKAEFINSIHDAALSVGGINGVHDILVHNYGHANIVSLHIEVDKNMELAQAHHLATAVENEIRNKLKASAVVHIDLHEPTQKLTAGKIKKVLNTIMQLSPEVVNYHDVKFTSSQGLSTLDFHVIVKYDMPVEDAHALSHFLTKRIQKELKGYAVSIHIEPCDEKCEICSRECKKI